MMQNDVAEFWWSGKGCILIRAEAGGFFGSGIKKETGYEPVPNFSLTNALITTVGLEPFSVKYSMMSLSLFLFSFKQMDL